MSQASTITDVMDEILQSVLASPKRQRRLLSKTFWEKLGFKARTKERIEQVEKALQERSLMVNFDDATFGTEDRDEWVILTYIEKPTTRLAGEFPPPPSPVPPDPWFEKMAHRTFESEREVEYYFVAPLMEQLGYDEGDSAIGHPVQMFEGVQRVTKEADFALFNGQDHSIENALLVVEAKRIGKVLTEDVAGQARAYAMWLTTPYYVLTNGDEIRVYLFRGAVLPDVPLMNFKRSELKQNWETLYKTLNKAAVIEHKEQLVKLLNPNGPKDSSR